MPARHTNTNAAVRDALIANEQAVMDAYETLHALKASQGYAEPRGKVATERYARLEQWRSGEPFTVDSMALADAMHAIGQDARALGIDRNASTEWTVHPDGTCERT